MKEKENQSSSEMSLLIGYPTPNDQFCSHIHTRNTKQIQQVVSIYLCIYIGNNNNFLKGHEEAVVVHERD